MLFCHMVRMVKILRCVKALFTKTVKTKLLNLKKNFNFWSGGKKCLNFSFWINLKYFGHILEFNAPPQKGVDWGKLRTSNVPLSNDTSF